MTVPGANRRTDVADIIRLLLAFGADPNQRGINDYTPLHMAVAERNPAAVRLLLDGGADPELRTRIDSYETPLEMADAARPDRHRGDAPLDSASSHRATTARAAPPHRAAARAAAAFRNVSGSPQRPFTTSP